MVRSKMKFKALNEVRVNHRLSPESDFNCLPQYEMEQGALTAEQRRQLIESAPKSEEGVVRNRLFERPTDWSFKQLHHQG